MNFLQHLHSNRGQTLVTRNGGGEPNFMNLIIVAAFRGMHVSPAKHSSTSVTDGRMDRQADRRRTKSTLCVAMLLRRHKNS